MMVKSSENQMMINLANYSAVHSPFLCPSLSLPLFYSILKNCSSFLYLSLSSLACASLFLHFFEQMCHCREKENLFVRGLIFNFRCASSNNEFTPSRTPRFQHRRPEFDQHSVFQRSKSPGVLSSGRSISKQGPFRFTTSHQ